MKNGPMFDWNDVRHFLAVARGGSTLAASVELKVSQPTVARRITALEEALGVPLFERRQDGYRPTEEGAALVPMAEAIERSATAFADGARARARNLQGSIRLTCPEMTAPHIGPLLVEFRKLHPDIRVDMVATEAFLDLAIGEADIAIRGSTAPPQGAGLYARKLMDVPALVYCSRAYADANGWPRSPNELSGHAILAGDGPFGEVPPIRWIEEVAPNAPVVARAASWNALCAYIKGGVGVGVAPYGLFEGDPDMVFCMELPSGHTGATWLVTHERARKLPRVRALIDFIAAYVAARNWPRTARERAPMYTRKD
jgi:DNA-binding transcriptional LysR family regulator